jgi:hypothetical protein
MPQFKTPILFLIFNRPDTTAKVFEAIRKIRPKYLYVAADGPRTGREGEKEKCEMTRALVQQVDWPCDVKTLFRDENYGCGKAVSSALSWFFENVEEGIILEDDSLPHNEFFPYCEELLDRYRSAEDVKFIGGANFQDGKKIGNASYYFSAYSHVWGWASWKRVWNHYNYTLDNVTWSDLEHQLEKYYFTRTEREHWKDIYDKMKNHLVDTWDYQLTFSIWMDSGVCIIPNVNLVSNIGFNDEATHTNELSWRFSNIRTASIFPIQHAENVQIYRTADKRYYDRKVKITLMTRIHIKISNFIRRMNNS